MDEAPRVHAVAEGLLLDGKFIVTWAELDRVRSIVMKPPSPAPAKGTAV